MANGNVWYSRIEILWLLVWPVLVPSSCPNKGKESSRKQNIRPLGSVVERVTSNDKVVSSILAVGRASILVSLQKREDNVFFVLGSFH